MDAWSMTDKQEFEEFYRLTVPSAAGYVQCLCANRAEAEDIVHDGYLTALRQWNTFAGRGSRKAWLMGILRNTFLSWNRRRKVRIALSLGLLGDRITAPQAADDAGLWEAVQMLQAHHGEIIYLRFAGGLSYAEMAQSLGIPEGTVRSRLHRALNELKERLDHDERTD